MSRLLVFGDLHCDRRHLRGLVERAVAEHCDALVSLGDLNYLPREPEGRRFLRSAGALLRRAGLELLLVEGNHDDAEALAGADARTRAPGPVRLGFSLHHLPAGTRFRLGRLRCLAYGGSPIAHAGRGWFRAAALERAAFERLAGGGEIDLLFCHDPRTLEQGTHARGPFAALAAKLRPALVIYGHQPPARERRRTARACRARLLPGRTVLGRGARQRRNRQAGPGAAPTPRRTAGSRVIRRQPCLLHSTPAIARGAAL